MSMFTRTKRCYCEPWLAVFQAHVLTVICCVLLGNDEFHVSVNVCVCVLVLRALPSLQNYPDSFLSAIIWKIIEMRDV